MNPPEPSKQAVREEAARTRHLFDAVIDLLPGARSARLSQEEDAAVRREVEALLEAHDQVEEVLHQLDHPVAHTVDWLIGQRFSHYEIEEKLGGGGMGVVYQARDAKLDRTVALKFLPPHLATSEEAKERFIQEAKAASALDHPNIGTIYEIGETGEGRLFIAMAYYAGETLKAKIARGPLPVEEVVDYATQVAQGLERAHEAGIVHRDVKPANVMVTRRGRVKLVDFGLAKMAGTELTKKGATMGTVAYMSPEQTRGEAVDARTDLWSLGVGLYEMLTGGRPFRGESDRTLIHAIRHDAPVPLKDLRPNLPASLAQVVEKLLRKDPGERYQRAEALLADLRTLQREGEASQLAARQAASRARRRRIVRHGSVAALVLVLVGLVYLMGWNGEEVASPPTSLKDEPSIAVLPLENRSGEEEQAYFAEGTTDELIATLTKIAGLRVVPRQSVMHFKTPGQPLTELAQRLQVDYFVDGSVLWAGEQARVTVNLIDPVTETSLWGQSFVGAQREVLALQQEVARAVVQEVEVQLTPEDEARLGQAQEMDPEAYELFRQGWHIKERAGGGEPLHVRIQKAIPYFEQAIAIDSAYAEAYAQLGSAYVILGLYQGLPWEKAISQAEWYLERSIALDDTHPAVYRSKGLLLQLTGDWVGAEEAFRHAIGLDPGNPATYCMLGLLMFRTGRPEEGLELATYALGLDPVSYFAHQVKVQAQIFLRRHDEAIASSRKVLELYPGHWLGRWGLGRAYLGEGRREEALAVSEVMVSRHSSEIGQLGYVYAVVGRHEEALKILEALKARRADERGAFEHVSRIHTALGEEEQALDWLEQTHKLLDFYKVDPAFDTLRSEPRFQAFLKKMGLDP